MMVLERVEREQAVRNKDSEPQAVLCRYCFNMEHWVPVSLVTTEVRCRLCDVCPMYVPLGEWEDHDEHGAKADTPTLVCTQCPLCRGIIPPDEPMTLCTFCPKCKAYVPVNLLEQHAAKGCYGDDDPFA